jgi:hypothetical protein
MTVFSAALLGVTLAGPLSVTSDLARDEPSQSDNETERD